MKEFLYETHLHTCQGSACADTEGKVYPRLYQDLGYDGIFITDHFFGGNTAAPRSGDWKNRVDEYMRGYEDARNEAEKIGFKVFFGIEQCFQTDEFLIYGIDRQYLYDHPEIEHWSRHEMSENIHAAGGCCVHAHPFRERGYIKDMHISPYTVDAIEAVNMGNHASEDATGITFAGLLRLPMTCGSDVHSAQSVMPGKLCAMGLESELHSAHDYVKCLLNHGPIHMHFPINRVDGMQPTMPHTPAFIVEKNESQVPFLPNEWFVTSNHTNIDI